MTRLLVALALFGLGTLAVSAAEEAPKVPKDVCVKPCFDCAAECFVGMKHAREHKMEDMAKQMEVCHHACLMCHHAVASKNVRAWEICELCEKVCNDCAAACEKSKDESMKKHAKACRDCAAACAAARK
jgi:hypothetical protein